MTLVSHIQTAAGKLTSRRGPRLLTVSRSWRLTPNMIRVVFAGAELSDFPADCGGGNCKLLFPEPGETIAAFAKRLAVKPGPAKRTYTVRNFDPELLELSIDFVAHGDTGPASRWASHARPGSFLGFQGPSGPKVTHFEADWYLVAADPSAISVAAATLEAMPRNAQGTAIFEITSAEDRLGFEADIDIPGGINVHWLIHSDPHRPSNAQEDLIRALTRPKGRLQTCIAGESGTIRELKRLIIQDWGIPAKDAYVSGYWKIGLTEDRHQEIKRQEM